MGSPDSEPRFLSKIAAPLVALAMSTNTNGCAVQNTNLINQQARIETLDNCRDFTEETKGQPDAEGVIITIKNGCAQLLSDPHSGFDANAEVRHEIHSYYQKKRYEQKMLYWTGELNLLSYKEKKDPKRVWRIVQMIELSKRIVRQLEESIQTASPKYADGVYEMTKEFFDKETEYEQYVLKATQQSQ